MTAGSAASVDRDRNAADLPRRIRSAGVFVLVFLGAIFAGPWVFAGLLALISLIGAFEMSIVLAKLGWARGRFWVFLAPVATMAILLKLPPADLRVAALLFLVTLVAWLVRPVSPAQLESAGRPDEARRLAAWAPLAGFLGLLYLSLLPAFLARMHAGPWLGGASAETGAGWVLYAVFLVWASDTGAYAIGVRFGRHRLWPAVSPKKTWEGVFGGVAATVLAAALLARPFQVGLDLGASLGAGLLVGIVAPVGDLLESRLKRVAGIKDSGALMPGHGGVLDRFDSLFFCAPLFYYYLHLIAGRV